MPDDDLKSIAAATLGRVLKSTYRLERRLGIGGMATLYAATHRNRESRRHQDAPPGALDPGEHAHALLREGYVANSVDHPGAVSVHDDDVAEDGSAFLVMDLLVGSPLDVLLAATPGGCRSGRLFVSIGDALLDVLAAAHAEGSFTEMSSPPTSLNDRRSRGPPETERRRPGASP